MDPVMFIEIIMHSCDYLRDMILHMERQAVFPFTSSLIWYHFSPLMLSLGLIISTGLVYTTNLHSSLYTSLATVRC